MNPASFGLKLVACALLTLATLAMNTAAPASAAPIGTPAQATALRPLPTTFGRVVLLGDSITDGITYPLLLEQSLREAGYALPLLLNAGIGGNTAGDMSERLERDVLSRQPTMVLFSAGINDAFHNVTPADYEKSVVSVLDRLHAHGVAVVLLLPGTLRPYSPPTPEERAKLTPDAQAQLLKTEAELPARYSHLDDYRAILRRLSHERGLPVADIATEMQAMAASDNNVWESDGTHLNFAGYRAWVRAVLDGLNLPGVAVPTVMRIAPASGIFPTWAVHARPKGATRLDAQSLTATLALPDWKPLTLPMPMAFAQREWWPESVRQRGVALDLAQTYGSDHLVARTSFRVDAPRTAFLNTGAGVTAAWIQAPNGAWAPAWIGDGTATGWHASKRARLELVPGDYQLVIECGGQFFVSVGEEEL